MNLQYFIWNIFILFILCKGIQGNHGAQYLYVTLQWFFVFVLCVCHVIINMEGIKTIHKFKNVDLNSTKYKTFITHTIEIIFFSILLWYGWVWTAFAVLLQYTLVRSLKSELKKKLNK